ncbi:MAG TPA: BMC domain-containing protein [Flavobacteriales bacterium]|nr:BMC domain-containing protein [Flavobacteriales bacterium]
MEHDALALLEVASIAVGMRTLDALIKEAPVHIVESNIVEPGKFLILFGGGVAEVESSFLVGKAQAAGDLVDSVMIPFVDPRVWRGIRGETTVGKPDTLGVVEGAALASVLEACDACLKMADVRLCVLCSSADTFSDSDCYPLPLIAHNRLSHTVTVAQRLQAGQRVFWAQRDAGYAATQLSNQLDAYRQQHGRPDFALLFSCGSRGPHLYDGQDRDWRAVRQTFPAMPLLGIYGNGQFAPLADGNRLLDGSAVLALFHGAEHV